jgi:hypothetical protein
VRSSCEETLLQGGPSADTTTSSGPRIRNSAAPLYFRRKRSGRRQERTIGGPIPAPYRACGAAAPERRKLSEMDDAREEKARARARASTTS